MNGKNKKITPLKKYILYFLGVICILLGLIGAALPILPTTPFLILATYFFSQSDERIYYYLLQHKVFGRSISNWVNFSVISKKAKKYSILMITASFLSFSVINLLYFEKPVVVYLVIFSILFFISYYIYTRNSSLPKTYLILGYGDIAKELIQEIFLKHHDKNIKIYTTSRNLEKHINNPKFSKLNKKLELIHFNLNEKNTWKKIPFVNTTFWTFPCKEKQIVLNFWKEKKYLLGKVIGIGTTSIYLEPAPQKKNNTEKSHLLIDELSVKNPESIRWKIEQQLINDGAIWGIAAGLYDKYSHPSKWLTNNIGTDRIHPENYVNLIHKHDCARALIYLSNLKKNIEKANNDNDRIYNICDNQNYLWKDLAEQFYQQGLLKKEIYFRFLEKEKLSPKNKKIKNISNKKLLSTGFSLKHNLNR